MLAQEPPPAPQSRPIFRAGVDTAYVVVDVVVTDKKDKPVKSLKASDFEILDAGVAQTVLNFDYVSIPSTSRSIDLKADDLIEPDVAVNPPPPRTGRAFVFVIDDGTVRPVDLIPAKRIMTDFLKKLTPEDETAVVYIKRSDLGLDFTHNVPRLIRGVNNISAAVGWSPDARATKEVLDNVVSTLALAPQNRRAVIYLGSGFTVCPPTEALCETRDNTWRGDDLVALFNRARHADVPIYTLDPSGLGSSIDTLNLGGAIESQTPGNRRRLVRSIAEQQQFLLTMSGATGGRGFVNQSNSSFAVNEIVADNSGYYVLGYSPSPFEADGRFHPLEVKVKGRSDLRVRARQGYLARRSEVIADPVAATMKALEAGQPQGDLGLRAFAAPLAEGPNGVRTALTIDVEYPALPEGETRTSDDLQIAVLALDSDGNVKLSTGRQSAVAFDSVGTAAGTLPVNLSVDLPEGQLILRVGVTSRLLGTTGTVHLPIAVRSPSGKGPVVTPLVIGLPPGSSEGLALSGLVPFQPTTRRTFSRQDTVRVFTRIFAEDVETLTSSLQVKDGKKVVRTIDVQAQPQPDTSNVLNVSARLSFADLSPGNYVLEFATRRARDKPVTRAIPLEIK